MQKIESHAAIDHCIALEVASPLHGARSEPLGDFVKQAVESIAALGAGGEQVELRFIGCGFEVKCGDADQSKRSRVVELRKQRFCNAIKHVGCTGRVREAALPRQYPKVVSLELDANAVRDDCAAP